MLGLHPSSAVSEAVLVPVFLCVITLVGSSNGGLCCDVIGCVIGCRRPRLLTSPVVGDLRRLVDRYTTLKLSTRNLEVAEWTVNDQTSSYDNRLITCWVSSAGRSAACAQPANEPVRFRDLGVDWEKFESTTQFRIGRIPWRASAARVAESFTDAVTATARVSECAKAEYIWRV
ncbi:hypothetical protein EVAR_38027_1 [Eumeta japonica]|uniref:Uncharacterized protein n=1 Tax=Eumeta variegata TaxID=151549 RepID=A0A4C1W8B5_EUMVA|nr:hypothetical protein EVAR_38027_1 [Eumeta japonica]